MKIEKTTCPKDWNLMKKSIAGCLKILTVTSAQASHTKSATPGPSGHVMLSYNWSTKELVREIKKELNSQGFKTWIDDENIDPGSLIDSMEGGVSNAQTILICYSEGYKRSANCRMEAEYALKQKKPLLFVNAEKDYKPDGWLSFIMGQSLYYDLAGKPGVMEQLIKHVRKIFEGKEVALESAKDRNNPSAKAERAEGKSKNSPTNLSQSAKQDAKKEEPSFLKWTEEKVQDWLKIKKLDFLLEMYCIEIILLIPTFMYLL